MTTSPFLLLWIYLNIFSVSLYYSWILYLRIHLHAKIYLWPPNQYSQHFVVIPRFMHAQSSGNLSCQMCTVPATIEQGDAFCLLVVAVILWIGVLFAVYLVPHFLHFCAFCWWVRCLKWPEYSSEVLSSVPRSCDVPCGKNMYFILLQHNCFTMVC